MALNNTRLLIALVLALGSTTLANTTWYVNGASGIDSNNCLSALTACRTIGHAISLASSGDTIKVAAATYTELLTIPESLSITIVGSGAGTTIIDGGKGGTVVSIENNARATISKVTIRNGRQGIFNNFLGTLQIVGSIITGNGIYQFCKTGCRFEGGGIYNAGTLSISRTLLSGNFVRCSSPEPPNCFAEGGGVYNAGTLSISSSTISANSAAANTGGYGGGIYNTHGILTISNSTLSGNAARYGGAISNHAAKTILQNSIVANNSDLNCSGKITSNGYNLSSDASCHFAKTGDLNKTDPQLGPLQNNGGPTQTMALPSGSPAIDAGNPNGCTDAHGVLLKTDQRGKPRPDPEDTGGCDMGAYERQTD